MKNIIVFASGQGSNFEAIVKSSLEGIINANIECLICNRDDANVINIANEHNIKVHVLLYTKGEDRKKYYDNVMNVLKKYKIDLVVLAGWMLIVTYEFIESLNKSNIPIINLHPALPNQYNGIKSMERAYDDFKKGLIKNSGLMVHYVIPEIDAGKVIHKQVVPFYDNDTFEQFQNRMKYFEKPLLISSINTVLNRPYGHYSVETIYSGKVRDILQILCNNSPIDKMIMMHTDKLSAFNYHVCNVSGKGNILLNQNVWWLTETNHIIKNHYITHFGNGMVIKKSVPILLEFIVRGYMAGSMWRNYKKGQRDFNGHIFRDGMVEYQKLDEPIVTPTTKDKDDKPITKNEIIEQYILTEEEYNFIETKAIELYLYGNKVVYDKGLILADTKYEFGRYNKEIILIDELHTSDSSRFWSVTSYQSNDKYGNLQSYWDKDIIRNWILKESNEMNISVNEFIRIHKNKIPYELIERVHEGYNELYTILTKPDYNFKVPTMYYASRPCYDDYGDVKLCLKYIQQNC